MKKTTIIGTLLAVFITLPIGFYLTYVLLKHANVDRLVWFLFIIYIPITVLITIFLKIGENE